MSTAPARPGGDTEAPRPTIPNDIPSPIWTASVGVVKAAVALILMAIFFALFLIAPGPTAGGALIGIVLFELLRRR